MLSSDEQMVENFNGATANLSKIIGTQYYHLQNYHISQLRPSNYNINRSKLSLDGSEITTWFLSFLKLENLKCEL